MNDETKLESAQLVDAWVRMYCAGIRDDLTFHDASICADAGIEELRKRLPVEGEAQPTQRTAEEWRAECKNVAGELWGDGAFYHCRQIGRLGWTAFAGLARNDGTDAEVDPLVRTEEAPTESDALEQLHAALSKRLEQKRRREASR